MPIISVNCLDRQLTQDMELPFFNAERSQNPGAGTGPEHDFDHVRDAERDLADRFGLYGNGNATGLLLARELDHSLYSTVFFEHQPDLLNRDQVVYRYYGRMRQRIRQDDGQPPRAQFLVVAPFRLWRIGSMYPC